MADPSRLPQAWQREVPSEAPEDVPEVLVISALLDSGRFDPAEVALTEEHLSCYQPVWLFCSEYHTAEGKAPPLDLVRRKFPDFPYLKGIGLHWAADELHRASRMRTMRRVMQASIAALNAGDHDTAHQLLSEVSATRGSAPLTGLSVFDTAMAEEDPLRVGLPMPWPTLMRISSGIVRGELWYLGARTGQGKSWVCASMAVSAMEAGARVRYVSLEMPAKAINKRVLRLLARKDPELRRLLFTRGGTFEDRRKAQELLRSRVPGEIDTIDPSMQRITSTTIDEIARDVDLVVIDHMGLMSDATGRRSIEDWRVAATISNVAKETTLKRNVPILGAVQINREGDNNGPNPPKISHLAQTTALEQDADVVITMKQRSPSVVIYSAEKVRESVSTKWYSQFDPASGDFSEISKDQALAQIGDDEDRVGDA